MFLVWKHLGLPAPTPLQYAMIKYAAEGPDRAMIQAFRGAAKSWAAAVLVLFTLYENPQANVVVVSASKMRADAFTQFCLRLINEMPLLAHLRPRPGQRQSMVEFDVGPARASQAPSVVSIGITGMMTGMRADLIIPDDVEIPSNSDTVIQREKLAERVKEFDALLKPGGRICYLGTPQTQDSIYNLLPGRGYEIRIWPALYPDEALEAAYEGRLDPDIWAAVCADPKLVGQPTEPTRFPLEDLERRRLSYGRAGFALQYMLDPRLSDEDLYPLKLRDMIVFALDPRMAPDRIMWTGGPESVIETLDSVGMKGDRYHRGIVPPETKFSPYSGVIMAIDPSGRGKDETSYAVVAALHGMLYLLDAGGFKGYDEPTLEALCEVAKKWGVNRIEVEPNFGDGMFVNLMKPVMARSKYQCQIQDSERSRAQKEARIIDTLRPVLEGHRLVVNQELIERDMKVPPHLSREEASQYRLFYQLTHVTRERGCLNHDDRIDALALAVHCWKHVIAGDQETAAARADEERRAQVLADFAAGVFHKQQRPAPKVWARRV